MFAVLDLTVLFAADYPDGSNSSEYLVQPTTYLPENFTYGQDGPCPERLPSMSEYTGVGGRCSQGPPLCAKEGSSQISLFKVRLRRRQKAAVLLSADAM